MPTRNYVMDKYETGIVWMEMLKGSPTVVGPWCKNQRLQIQQWKQSSVDSAVGNCRLQKLGDEQFQFRN